MISLLISYVLIFSVALMLVAFGGMFSERSGVINIGLEGTMVVGGFIALIVLNALNAANANPFLVVIVTTLVAIVAGMIYSLLLAVACITLKADQTLIGTAMNLLATALALIVTKRMSDRGASTSIQYNKDMFVFDLFGVEMNVFLIVGIVALVLAIIVLYKLKFGLRLKACGENPSAADSVGINVTKYRYAGVLISGGLAGVGALAYILPTQSFWNSASGVSGFGFLALAVMIFGQWKPGRISLVSLFFSLFLSLSFIYNGIFYSIFGRYLTSSDGVTSELFKMIPYILSLLLLAFTSKNHHAPKAEGIPYDKEAR